MRNLFVGRARMMRPYYAQLLCLSLLGSARALSTPPKGPRLKEIGSTSALTKGLVSSLTTAVNALGGKSAQEPTARVRDFESLTGDAILDGLRRDFVEKEYLWSGQITAELYDEACVFTDPTLSFKGLSTFEANLENLDPWINRFVPAANRRVELYSLRLTDDGEAIEASWRMLGDLALPWKPRLDLKGRTRYTLGGQGGRIRAYDEAWAITPSEALLQLVKPYRGEDAGLGSVLEDEQTLAAEQRPGRLEGAARCAAPRMGAPTPIVILPGFGNADVDYKTPFNQPEELGFCSVLARRGFEDVTVVELPRWEWVRVAGGLFDLDFWLNRQKPESLAYGWYVERARRTIVAASERNGGARVLVIGHSAGGWLARATLGQGIWELAEEDEGEPPTEIQVRDVVCGLVTLGAPHFPPPEGSPPCATRGALAYCDKELPGAYLATKGMALLEPAAGVAYVTVAGAAIQGNSARPDDDSNSNVDPSDPTLPARELLAGAASRTEADEVYAKRGEGSAARVAFTNYQALAGDGEAEGDGVIPVGCAHLPGALQLTLDGVLHSINEAGTTLPTERWYGSEKVVDRWLEPTLAELKKVEAS